jgi:arsenate reductase
MKDIILIHNSNCSKCRATFKILEDHNCKIQVINYLDGELTEEILRKAIDALKVHPREVLRTKEEEFKNLNLDLNDDEAVIKAILKHPNILERPIVMNEKGAVIARPPENVLKLLS